ncbi:hypothetical protein [Natrialba sp. INN-245]|uniref:hypothetical protein n=1 Tax=Natrialba sp. INN-245 TaxID=2690967 RepID=UPI001312C7EB|nr:hypothetical protein [Natrialba sp. INN-245]MWV39343.1 hypothetical protein [Natrialba sp. INN-245]
MIEIDDHAEERPVDDEDEGRNGVAEDGDRFDGVDEDARDDERDRCVMCGVDRGSPVFDDHVDRQNRPVRGRARLDSVSLSRRSR